MTRPRFYTLSAVAHLMGQSPSWLSSRWRGMVESGKLPKPMMFGKYPKFCAEEIDRLIAARSFEDAPKIAPAPALPQSDPELARRGHLIAISGGRR